MCRRSDSCFWNIHCLGMREVCASNTGFNARPPASELAHAASTPFTIRPVWDHNHIQDVRLVSSAFRTPCPGSLVLSVIVRLLISSSMYTTASFRRFPRIHGEN